MKLGIIGNGMIVNDLLSFVKQIDEIELIAIYGRKIMEISGNFWIVSLKPSIVGMI